jgi:UDP-N-acetylglucosamine--N-acetylmuramyl-(pentapeptide) pyrophosphoryl-undecaprenol N-acetylglucosamine transferase
MRLALTGGGTGGHILPAMAVFEAMRSEVRESLDVRFFGPDNRGESLRVAAYGIPFERVPAAAIRGRSAVRLARSAFELIRGAWAATRKLRSFNPDVIFSTGGYGSFPCCLAARLLRKPLIVYLPDVEPGWAVKAERRLATRIATTTDAALAWLPKEKAAVTGYPVRPEFFSTTRAGARAQLRIPEGEKVLVIAGASQGAHAINEAAFRGLRSFVEEFTVFHITGEADYDDAAGFGQALGSGLVGRYHVSVFRDDLPVVMAAADLAVMRSGASVLGELPAAGLPAILVPGTFAGGHQRQNAQWLADHGAAVVLEEDKLHGLGDTVLNLMNDEDRLAKMAAAAKALSRPQAAHDIARLCMEVAK